MFRFVRNPDPRKKPPYGSRIDPAHPLAQGLVVCYLFNEGAGLPFNMIYPKEQNLSGSSDWNDGGLYFPTNSYLETNITSEFTEAPLTLLTRVKLFDVENTFRQDIISKHDYNYAFTANHDDLRWTIYNGSWRNIILADVLEPNTFLDLAGSTGPAGSIVYCNGNKACNSSYTTFTSTPDTILTFASHSGGGYGSECEIYYVYGYNRQLPDIEIEEIHNNPYSFILVPQYWYLVDFGAVGGGIVTGTADIQASTSTNDAVLAVLRKLSASIQVQTATSTPDLSLLLTAIADIQAISNTSTVALNILRAALASILSQSTTSSALLEIIRGVVVDIQTQTATPDDVELLVSGLVTGVANILVETTTSTAGLNVIRELAAAINAQTFASDSVELSIAGIITAIANVLAQTTSSEPILAVTRTSQADVQTQTITSSAILGLLHSLSASIQIATTTSDDVDLVIVKLGQAQIIVSTATAEAALTIIHSLTASIQAETTTSEALLAVLKQATAGIDAQTLTSAINLVTTGLGLIIDTTIESLTQTRTIESLTQTRTIEEI